MGSRARFLQKDKTNCSMNSRSLKVTLKISFGIQYRKALSYAQAKFRPLLPFRPKAEKVARAAPVEMLN